MRRETLRFLSEERGGFLRLAFAALEILAEKQAGQLVRHPLGGIRRSAIIGHGEGDGGLGGIMGSFVYDVGADDFYFDILDEAFDDLLRRVFLTHPGIEIILLDDFPEAGTAHDLLFDHFDSLIRIAGDGAVDQLGRDFLFLDQNRCCGLEGRRPENCRGQAQ